MSDENYNENGGNVLTPEDDVALIIGNFMGEVDIPAFIKFSALPSIPAGSKLLKAELALFNMYDTNYNNVDFQVGVFEATSDWTDNDNLINEDLGEFYDSTTPIDCKQVLDDGTYGWNITSLYEKWQNGGSNHGMCVKAVNLPQTSSLNICIASSDNTDGYMGPRLEILYVDNLGIEEYNGVVSSSVGTDGTSYINLYNGALTYVQRLTSNCDEHADEWPREY